MSNSPLGFNFHLIRSPTSRGGVLATNIRRKCSPSSISHSIKISNKMNIPNSPILRPLPRQRSFYRCLLIKGNTIQPWKSQLERLIPILPILPKSHSIPQSDNKLTIFAKILPTHTNTSPQTKPVSPSY